jgi:hypothetical protein
MTREFGVNIPTRERYFLVSKTSRLALLPTSQIFNAYRSSFPGVSGLEHGADHPPVSSVKVKNEWSCNFTPPIRFHAVDTDKCTFFALLLYSEDGGCRVPRNVYTFLPDYKKPHHRNQYFFMYTAMICIFNLTYRITCHAIRTFRRVTVLLSFLRVRNGGGTYFWGMILHGAIISAVIV